ncbi:MAG: hypothetical protein IKU87_02455 [Clostridia bacterium]|nr:hypothetical protein [Clostridia bacterium]
MITVSFKDYLNLYSGENNKIPEKSFSFFLSKAESFLNSLTMGKLAPFCETEEVKRCACEIAEIYYKGSQRLGISSENNDGYSVSYNAVACDKAAAEIAIFYLESTGLLYRGIG